jgi:ribosomal protein L35AE/L33A
MAKEKREKETSLDPVRSNALFLSFKRVRQHQADNQALVKKEKRAIARI